MKNAAIVTLWGNNNFGNKLQNYALQEILKMYNIKAETIINMPLFNNRRRNIKKVLSFRLRSLYYFLTKKDKINDIVNHSHSREKKDNFLRFNQNINASSKMFTFRRVSKFDKYDYYFVGSDQIWNPKYGGLSDFDLLSFTNNKKISISASFGIEELPDEYKMKAKKYLDNFDAISVREESGKKIINELLPHKNVEVLIDPTLMLNQESWNKVSNKPRIFPQKKYILCYFLGGISEERMNIIEKTALNYDMEVVNLSDKNGKYNFVGPSEFLFLESHASLIMTDSFHSSIFAILYQNPFVVFEREGKHTKMGSRIDTLLKKLGLEDRKYNQEIDLERFFNVDYSIAQQKIGEERAKFNEFVKKSI